MESHNNKWLQEVEAALGKPKYYLDAPDKLPGEQYYWFPNQGDSMNDNTSTAIPGGSLTLGRLLPVTDIAEIPLHRPMIFIIDYNGERFCLLKSPVEVKIADENTGYAQLCLRSYNPAPGYDDLWLPFQHIRFIFLVEKVRRPNGTEFVPVPGDNTLFPH
ncbi:MAG TPA: hypothetical protein VM187_07160 [Niastella sp.]|nr:hypothetical protein [Niastella sp.]